MIIKQTMGRQHSVAEFDLWSCPFQTMSTKFVIKKFQHTVHVLWIGLVLGQVLATSSMELLHVLDERTGMLVPVRILRLGIGWKGIGDKEIRENVGTTCASFSGG